MFKTGLETKKNYNNRDFSKKTDRRDLYQVQFLIQNR